MATIFESIRAGDVEAVRSAVRNDPSVAASREESGLSAVRAALYVHKQDVADALLEAEPELDVFDAAAVGDVDRLTELLDGDAGIRCGDSLLLMNGASRNNTVLGVGALGEAFALLNCPPAGGDFVNPL